MRVIDSSNNKQGAQAYCPVLIRVLLLALLLSQNSFLWHEHDASHHVADCAVCLLQANADAGLETRSVMPEVRVFVALKTCADVFGFPCCFEPDYRSRAPPSLYS
jgi:hypothetical protein